MFLQTQVWTGRLPCTLGLYFSSYAGCLGDLACGAGAEFRRPAELCGTLSCQSSPFSLSGPTIALLNLISPHSATTAYQGLLFSKLSQKVCERVGFRFDSDWKGLRHQPCEGSQAVQWATVAGGWLSCVRNSFCSRPSAAENKQSEVSVRDARRVRDCESGAW